MFQAEHVAWQVRDPLAVAEWYATHLGFRILRQLDDQARTHFLVDHSGQMVVEIYDNPDSIALDYPTLHPLQLHIAFAVADVKAARDALLNAGCTVFEDYKVTPAGDEMVMLKDPWGFAVQLVKRAAELNQ